MSGTTSLGAPIDVGVTSASGTLVLVHPSPLPQSGTLSVLVHDGCAFYTTLPRREGTPELELGAGELRFTVPAMEPGAYSPCWGTCVELPAALSGALVDRCVTGVLRAGDTLRLKSLL